MAEEWRVIPANPHYEASNEGRIRSARYDRVLKAGRSKGYLTVSLGRGTTRSVHTCVARAFLGEPPAGHEVAHLDGDSTNNRLDNLSYLPHLDNMRHKADHGTQLRGVDVNTARLNPESVRELRRLREQGWTLAHLAARYGVALDTVWKCATRRSWAHV